MTVVAAADTLLVMQSMICKRVDEILVDRASRNDRDAFGTLYDRHSQRVFAH